MFYVDVLMIEKQLSKIFQLQSTSFKVMFVRFRNMNTIILNHSKEWKWLLHYFVNIMAIIITSYIIWKTFAASLSS